MAEGDAVLSETVQTLVAVRSFRFPKQACLSLVALAVLWQVASYFAQPFVIPGWPRILQALVTLPLSYVLVSGARIACALAVSFSLGTAAAILMYGWPVLEPYTMPIVRLLMAVPAICWIIFSVLWFKGVELRIGFVILIVCAPIFVVDLLDGMKAVPRDLRDMVRSFRPSTAHVFTKLILPAIVPTIITSWKINLSLAIRIVTFAELVGAVSGIGYGLVVAEELFSIADVFAWTVVMVFLLLTIEAAVAQIERHVLRWRTLGESR